MVEMLKPQTLSDVVFLARRQERFINSMNKGNRQWGQKRSSSGSGDKSWKPKTYDTSTSREVQNIDPPLKRLSPEEMLIRS